MRRLRSHLLAWLLLPLLLLLAAAFRLGYERSLAQAHEAYDRTLLGSALAIAERIDFHEGRALVDVPYAALEMLQTASQDRIYYKVTHGDGSAFVSGYEDLPRPSELPPAERPYFYEADFLRERLRLVALVRRVYDPQVSGPMLVLVGETMGAREQLSRRILVDALLTQLGLVLAAALLITAGVQFGLRPLQRLRAEVQARRRDDLSPIDTRDVPLEVVPLVDALNEQAARQRELAEAQKRFLANASHQLKTPLAVLRTQAAYALRQTELAAMREMVQRMHEGTESTTRLVTQLLTLARSDPGRPLAIEPVDLSVLAGEVLMDMMVLARSRRVDLGLEREPSDDGSPGPVVQGERLLLREMLANLVHNAIVHMPPGGTVTTRVRRCGGDGAPVIEVDDDGPGIPAAERQRVFDRFYRVAGAERAEGSGLGLAIAHDVCRRHDIDIALLDAPGGRGLRVRLQWPAVPLPSSG